MSVSTLHVLHGIDIAGTFISQLTGSTPSPQINTLLGEPAGNVQPQFISNAGQEPVVSFSSTQIKSLLDLAGVGMYDASSGNTDLYYKKAKNLSTRENAASSVHTRLRMANAGLVLSRISAGHDREASVDAMLVNPYDGSNQPIVPAGSIALSGTPAYTQSFRAGPVFLNGSQIYGVEDVTIDFGHTMISRGGDGELYPTFAGIRRFAPSITIRTPDLSAWTSHIGLNGVAISSLSVYLRKLTPNGAGPVADGTAQHMKFAATAGLATIENTSGGGNDDAVTGVRFGLVAPSDTGSALTFSSAIAITS